MEKTAVIEVRVTPKSSKSSIEIEDGGIRVKLHSPPIDGKANEECISLFAKVLGVPKSSVSIIRGDKGRQKTISIKGLSTEDATGLLKQGL